MDFKSVDEYVATLSEEEREMHKELIQECREREEQNRKSSEANQEAVVRLLESQEHLKRAVSDLREAAEGLQVRAIPKEKFAKA